MKSIKFSCCAIIALFILFTAALATVQAQDATFTDYVIKPDGSVTPNTSAITRNGNNYLLTQDITGTVVIQKDGAVFNGAGHTLKGNAVKGAYDLSDNVLYLDSGFNLTRAWNVTIQNVKIENSVNGITLLNSYYCRILNCTISGSAVDGMKIAWSSYNMVFWNTFISNADDGIQMINAEDNHIMINNIDSGSEHRANGNGIQINGNCSYNMFEGNNINAFDTGIFIDSSNSKVGSNLVSYNNFTSNSWNGVVVGGSYNLVTLNNFYRNGLQSAGSNCSGNYWVSNSSIYDLSPLTAPVNTNVIPEFIPIPNSIVPLPTPGPTDIRTVSPTSTSTSTSPTSTPNPSASTSPGTSNVPTPTAKLTQSISIWPIPVLLTASVFVLAIVFTFIALKARVKKQKQMIIGKQ